MQQRFYWIDCVCIPITREQLEDEFTVGFSFWIHRVFAESLLQPNAATDWAPRCQNRYTFLESESSDFSS